MHVSDLLRTRVLRYTAIAVLAFSVGSASVVLAASSGAMQLPVFRLADGTNPEQFAKVDAAGSVQVSVNNQPLTQQVSGTVSVSNFPATQNVNVTGTAAVRPAVVTRAVSKGFTIAAGEIEYESFTTINASYVHVQAFGNDVNIFLQGPLSVVVRLDQSVNHYEMSYTQRIPVNLIGIRCTNLVLECNVSVIIMGD